MPFLKRYDTQLACYGQQNFALGNAYSKYKQFDLFCKWPRWYGNSEWHDFLEAQSMIFCFDEMTRGSAITFFYDMGIFDSNKKKLYKNNEKKHSIIFIYIMGH